MNSNRIEEETFEKISNQEYTNETIMILFFIYHYDIMSTMVDKKKSLVSLGVSL